MSIFVDKGSENIGKELLFNFQCWQNHRLQNPLCLLCHKGTIDKHLLPKNFLYLKVYFRIPHGRYKVDFLVCLLI